MRKKKLCDRVLNHFTAKYVQTKPFKIPMYFICVKIYYYMCRNLLFTNIPDIILWPFSSVHKVLTVVIVGVVTLGPLKQM